MELVGARQVQFTEFWQTRARTIGIMVLIGTFLALLNPFGANDLVGFWRGWLFWVIVIVIGSLLGEFVSEALKPRIGNLPFVAQFLLLSVLMGLVMTPVVAVAYSLISGHIVGLRAWPGLSFGVWVISAFMTGLSFLLERAATARAAQIEPGVSAAVTSPRPEEAFLTRLPVRFRAARLEAIVSEDHYLRVHTDKGSHLILMRLSDAVRELEGAGGVQTHRSWWVARHAVVDTRRESGRLILIVGHERLDVPVSRTFAAQVRAAGLG